MKKSIIFINKDFYTYNGEKYDFDRFSEISDLLKSNIKIIILEEELFVKRFKDNIRRYKLSNFVDHKIKNDFPQNGDILYDFEKRKNNIIIYSIKGARRVEKLIKKANNIEIKPIQFIIKDIIMKITGKNLLNFNALVKYDRCYYYLSFRDGLYHNGFISENEDKVLNTLIKNNNFDEIYADYNTISLFSDYDNFKVNKINIGELINENIYEKQRVYSRKFL